MSRLWKGYIVVGLGLMLALAMLVCEIPNNSEAASAKDILNQEISYPDYFPKRFDGRGCIDRIDKNEIVISDSLYNLSKRIKCGTLKKPRIKRSHLLEGDIVGFVTNDEGVIVSLWKLH